MWLMPIMQYFTVVIIQFQNTILIHNNDSLIELKAFVFSFIPCCLVNVFYAFTKFFLYHIKSFLAINLPDIMNTWQQVEAIQVKHLCIQEGIGEYIVCTD